MSDISSYNIGVLIALYERAVGYYSSLININAFHQPGVEAGKKAASEIIDLQQKIAFFLNKNCDSDFSAHDIAIGINAELDVESIFHICQHLAASSSTDIKKNSAESAAEVTFFAK